MARRFKQGFYTPRNPDKYKGDASKIRYMSSWELDFHKFLDNNTNVLEWSSEEVIIPYVKPTTNRVHKYYVDYWLKYVDKHGNEKIEIIEVKPHKETISPKPVGKNKRTQLYEQVTWAINQAKWRQAKLYAQERGWTFRIITEKQLFK